MAVLGETGPANSKKANSKENALWLLERLAPEEGVNNLGFSLHVNGRLRLDALKESLTAVINRHAIFRTAFIATDAQLVKRPRPAGELSVEIERLELPRDDPGPGLSRFIARPFALDGGALLRTGLAATPDGDVFCVGVHHLVFDGASIVIFIRELVAAYEAVAAGRPLPPAVTSDAAEEGAAHEPGPSQADLAYWREQLRGFAPDTSGPWWGLPWAQRSSLSGRVADYTLTGEALTAIARLRREVRAPVTTVLLAAYFALLASHGAGSDLVVSSPLDRRGGELPTAIGYQAAAVPLRLRVDLTEGFRPLARRARDVFLAAMAHTSGSADDLLAELPRAKSSWQNPLYRHMFNCFPESGPAEMTIDGMTARLAAVGSGLSMFDLQLFAVTTSPEKLRLGYRDEVLGPADVEAFFRRFEALLIAVDQDTDRPVGEVAGWSEQDRATIDGANEAGHRAGAVCVPTAFLSRVRAAPDDAAIVDDEGTLSYGRVWQAAVAASTRLTAAGVGAGDVVAVIAPRCRDAIVCAFASWLAGAVYLPLAADHDAPRQAQRLGATALITGSGAGVPGGAGLPPVLRLDEPPEDGDPPARQETPSGPLALVDPAAPACAVRAHDPAGRETVVTVSHGGFADLISHFAAELDAGPGTGLLTRARPASPHSLLEFFLPLSLGGRVVTAGGSQADVDVIAVPPGVSARAFLPLARRRPGLRILASDQEMPPAVARELVAAGARPHAVWGTAGPPGGALSGPVDGATGLAAWRPVAGTRAFVSAPDGRELPPGLRGELCIAVSGLALTGPGAPAVTESARYGRAYRTGQFARWRPDGHLEPLGAIDRLVTVAGSPVQLDAVESVLRDHPAVAAATALAVAADQNAPSGHEETTLVAVAELVRETVDTGSTAELLREHARAGLPSAAVPQRVVCVRELPRAADGAIDRDAVGRLAAGCLGGDGEPASARPAASGADDPLVARLAGLWRQLLPGDVTTQTNFFAAGGHSLLAAKLAQDVEELTGTHLDLPEIFSYPTPSALAARLGELSAGSPAPAAAPVVLASPAQPVVRAGAAHPDGPAVPLAPADWGPAFSCYTSALAVYLAADDDRWWRTLADGGPHLRVTPTAAGPLRFEHHPRPPGRLIGLRAQGADDWEAAWAGIGSELDASGRVIIAADSWNVPWLTAYRRKHGPHWFVLARDGDAYTVDDPLDLVDEHGQQSPVRTRLSEADVRGCCGALTGPLPHLVLREEAALGSTVTALGAGYRWLTRVAPSPGTPDAVIRHGALELADQFARAAAEPASYLQVDDVWQGLRQRELLVRAIEVEEKLGELSGVPAREPWERVTELWRRLPPLLLHARLLAGAGGAGDGASTLVKTLRAIGAAESELAGDRFPAVSPWAAR